MVAYSFKKQFADPIRSGRKRQTIRANRKRHARPGEDLQLYTGMRTKQCRLVARAVCDEVVPIYLCFRSMGNDTFGDHVSFGATTINTEAGLDGFAQSDGFTDWRAMRDFWEKEHGALAEFNGVLIRWRDMEPAV